MIKCTTCDKRIFLGNEVLTSKLGYKIICQDCTDKTQDLKEAIPKGFDRIRQLVDKHTLEDAMLYHIGPRVSSGDEGFDALWQEVYAGLLKIQEILWGNHE